MSYLCRKPLMFGGRKYAGGDIIPDGTILNQRARKLLSMGYISVIADGGRAQMPDNGFSMADSQMIAQGAKRAPAGSKKPRRASEKTTK